MPWNGAAILAYLVAVAVLLALSVLAAAMASKTSRDMRRRLIAQARAEEDGDSRPAT